MSKKHDIDDFFAEFDKRPSKKKSESTQVSTERVKDVRELVSKSRHVAKSNGKHGGKGRGKRGFGRNWSRRKRILIYGLLGFATFCLGLFVFVVVTTPKVNPDKIYEQLMEASTVYDDKGKAVDTIYEGDGNRQIISYEDMPKDTVNAFIAIEDKTFRTHHGFNFVRMLGAIRTSIFGGGDISGTSTISQQLARNIWLRAEERTNRSILRKLREAWITVQIERKLTKDQIMEAYLNTIALGNNSLGIQSAAENYFSKDAKNLTLAESACLAAIPPSPTNYSYVNAIPKGVIEIDEKLVLKKTSEYTYIYNDIAADRQKLVLKLMEEQKYITGEQREKAAKKKIKEMLKPAGSRTKEKRVSYFTDFLTTQVKNDLMTYRKLSEEEAKTLIYSGGLKIYSTVNYNMQSKMFKHLENSDNYTNIVVSNRDENGNILNDDGAIVLYDLDYYIGDNGSFRLNKGEYKLEKDGTLILKKKKRLDFFDTTFEGQSDITVEFRKMYQNDDGKFYVINGGVLNIPAEYKTRLDNGDIEVSKKFKEDYPKFFKKSKSSLVFPASSYSLRDKVVQPQAAMVILEGKTGAVKAMTGGRNIDSSLSLNRVLSTRQPGSAIKPISVYGPALDQGALKKAVSGGEKSFGEYWTAGSVIEDKKLTFNDKVWPKNWYEGYKGNMTLRSAVEQSVNTIAVQTQANIGNETSIDYLKRFGISTLELEDRETNDLNSAALALGGLTNGIKPLEITAAYTAFPNEGVRTEPIAYTRIENNAGKVILEKKTTKTKVMTEQSAFIMNDILRTSVSRGVASSAKIEAQPVAGKTGTTDDKFDVWFVGSTPKYTAGLWMGNDIGLELSEGSYAAAAVWAKIMQDILQNTKSGEFPAMPSGVSQRTIGAVTDYFVDGTAPSTIYIENTKEIEIEVCNQTGLIATSFCPHTHMQKVKEKDGKIIDGPTKKCNVHTGKTKPDKNSTGSSVKPTSESELEEPVTSTEEAIDQ